MNLDIIKLQTTWNDAAGSINSNYAKIADAIAQLKANGGGGGGGAADTIVWSKVTDKPAWIIQAGNSKPKYSYDELTDTPDLSELATKPWVESELSDYAKTEDIPTTVSKLTDSGDYLKKASAEITYAKIASVQGFENRIGGLEGAVPQLNERVTTVEVKVSSLNETVSTGENNLLDRVNVIETDYVTSGNLESAINGIDLSAYLLKADLTKSRIQSTLGISDWALAATKPSYAWSEITSRPTALSQFTDDVVAGKYLPLSGGTISGTAVQPLYLKSNQSSCGILFFNSNNNATLMYSGGSDWRVTDNGWSNAYYLLHSGNIGNYEAGSSVWSKGLDRITSIPASEHCVYFYSGQPTLGDNINNAKEGSNAYHLWSYPVNGTSVANGTANIMNLRLQWSHAYLHDIFVSPNSDDVWHRSIIDKICNPWRKFAFTDSNVASATKLQTPRKLWGNNFDGTADVSGDITANKFIGCLRGDIIYDNGVDEGHFIGLGSNGVGVKGLLNYVYGNFPILFYTNGFERMRIGDYVGIGTTSPTERLDVSGNIKASGNINATSITINGVTITASNGSITVNGNVFATGDITGGV